MEPSDRRGDPAGDGWSEEEIRELAKGRWIARNWRTEAAHAAADPLRVGFCDALSRVEGPILEVAAGPGGGNLAPVLQRHPAARLIANDRSWRVLRLWEEFLREEGDFPNVRLVAFDARRMPLRDGSLAAISSVGGFTEVTAGDVSDATAGEAALAEAFRVLRSGGRLFALEATLESDDWDRIPADVRAGWEAAGLTRGLGPALVRAGFHVRTDEACGRRPLAPEEGELPKLAARYGARLAVTTRGYEAARPGITPR